MKEEFLYYLWQFQQIHPNQLKTTVGEEIIVLAAGQRNYDSGPDFLNAKIKIGAQVWVGNVEIHIKSSDWKNHKHDYDDKYKSVILHVVYEDDQTIFLAKTNVKIPTLVVADKFDNSLYIKYQYFLENKLWIPCMKQFLDIDSIVRDNWIERMAVERLESKTIDVEQKLNKLKGNWDELFYHFIARSYGFKVNSDSFEQLANTIPLKILAKHKQNLLQIESLLFGQAGMLNDDFKDAYPNELKKEYEYLRELYSLKPMSNNSWHFLRLRPSNFPTIRIAQFAKLINKSTFLFSHLIETVRIKDVRTFFETESSNYWNTHFVFDKLSKKSIKKIGASSIDNLLINTVIPVIFTYGKIKNDENIQKRMLEFLKTILPEKNAIIDNWLSIGIKANDAFTSQALIQLKNNYCHFKKCLNCGIGINLLKNS